jgi:ABC-type lipoprotein release transport system permease subunit
VRIPLLAKLAVRTLGRNSRRTLLSVVGVGVGVALTLFMTAFMRGSTEMRVRSIAESGLGHLRVAPAEWERSRDNDLRLADWRSELDALRSVSDVAVAAPHARSTALLAFGTRVAGVELLGVDPVAEQQMSRVARAVTDGRYLESGDANVAVVGLAIADRLEVELEDDLLLTVVGRGGEIQYAMLRIVGIVSTGSSDIDSSICHVTLEDLQRLTGITGAGEISVMLHDSMEIDRVAVLLRAVVAEGDTVLTWKEVVPGQGGDAASDRGFANALSGIVVAVVILGIAGAQLTAILERRREFAVLVALGMKGAQVVRLIAIESATLALLGAAAGLLMATPIVYHTSTAGFDFSALMGGDMAISGVLFDPIVYSDMGPWMIPHALMVAFVSMLVAAIYPTMFALRTNPTSALSLREA